MKICCKFEAVPAEIKDKLGTANLFYTAQYEHNAKARGQMMYYVWSENRILAARAKKQFFLKAVVLETEPFVYKDGDEDEAAFLTEAMLLLGKHGVQWTICANTARFQAVPDNSISIPCGNHIIDLQQDEETLWGLVHSKHRNSIRRGEKADIELRFGGAENLHAYVPLANETYGRSGKSGSRVDYYSGLMKDLEDNTSVVLAYKEQELQSGAMFYHNGAIAYYLHGASIARPEPGATNYLLWSAILHFKRLGVKEFSFVGYRYCAEPGSKLDGIQRFKERFGGKLENSYNFRYVQNPFAYWLYGLVMQLKAGKPFTRYKDVIDELLPIYLELDGKEGEK